MHNEYLREGFSMWHLPNLFNHKYFTLVYIERLVIRERCFGRHCWGEGCRGKFYKLQPLLSTKRHILWLGEVGNVQTYVCSLVHCSWVLYHCCCPGWKHIGLGGSALVFLSWSWYFSDRQVPFPQNEHVRHVRIRRMSSLLRSSTTCYFSSVPTFNQNNFH